MLASFRCGGLRRGLSGLFQPLLLFFQCRHPARLNVLHLFGCYFLFRGLRLGAEYQVLLFKRLESGLLCLRSHLLGLVGLLSDASLKSLLFCPLLTSEGHQVLFLGTSLLQLREQGALTRNSLFQLGESFRSGVLQLAVFSIDDDQNIVPPRRHVIGRVAFEGDDNPRKLTPRFIVRESANARDYAIEDLNRAVNRLNVTCGNVDEEPRWIVESEDVEGRRLASADANQRRCRVFLDRDLLELVTSAPRIRRQ